MYTELIVNLPTTRAKQLHKIAELRGESLESLIDTFTRQDWASLQKESDLPGFDISGDVVELTYEPFVWFTMSGTIPLEIPSSYAKLIADEFDMLVNGKKKSFCVPIVATFMDTNYAAERSGNVITFRIETVIKGKPRLASVQLTPSVVQDLCKTLRAAAADADKLAAEDEVPTAH